MTQKEKELLLKDLSARLSYGVIVQQSPKYVDKHFADKWETEPHNFNIIGVIGTNTLVTDKNTTERTYMKGIVSKPVTICIYDGLTKQTARPYLRPMSSMTKEEEQIRIIYEKDIMSQGFGAVRIYMSRYIDWLNSKHFDWRTDDNGKTLIEKDLAIEAPEGMY